MFLLSFRFLFVIQIKAESKWKWIQLTFFVNWWLWNIKKPTALQLSADTYWVNNITLVTVLFWIFSIDYIFLSRLIGKALFWLPTLIKQWKKEGPEEPFDLIGSVVAGSTLCSSALRGQQNYWLVLSFSAHSFVWSCGWASAWQTDRALHLKCFRSFIQGTARSWLILFLAFYPGLLMAAICTWYCEEIFSVTKFHFPFHTLVFGTISTVRSECVSSGLHLNVMR